jgi:soluble lytic murein transglycosylase-like protein
MLVQAHNASPQVAGAIRQAATSTGASFNYLLATAQIESNFNPAAQAATSSAKGLYQFIDQTWLGTMKAAGRALGLDHLASAISRGEDGRFEVQDTTAKQAIMNLRGDAKVSALMAGHYAQANAAQLKDGLGRAPTEGELYIAHFLGADGAAKLIDAATNRPTTRGADLFPSAAQANRPIFFDRSGNARTALGVYRELTGRYETARANVGADIAATPLRGALPAEPAAARVPDPAGIAQAYAAAQPVAYAAASKPPAAFQSIFSDPGRQGVAPVVRTLWTTPGDGAVQGPKPRNLFAD